MSILERIYCAGPWHPLPHATNQQNIERAVRQGQRVRELGFVAVVPHVAVFPGTVNEAAAMEECYSHLETCHAVVLLEDWDHSAGTKLEIQHAEARNLPVWLSIDSLAAAKKDGLPVTAAGLQMLLWRSLAAIIERQTLAGLQAPSQMERPWHHTLGLYECWFNGTAKPMRVLGLGETVIPPLHLMVHHCGSFLGIGSIQGFAHREGWDVTFKGFVKALRDEAERVSGVVQ